jgi:phage gp36-like protein
MTYIIQQDLEDELGLDKLIELTDDAGLGVIGVDRVGKAIGYAVGTFDSYARQRYAVPVPVTEKVKSVCLDLAVFHLYKSRATNATKEGVYGVKKDAHDLAMKFLEAVAMGKAALDVPSAEETVANPASADEVLRGSSQSKVIFSDDKLTGY